MKKLAALAFAVAAFFSACAFAAPEKYEFDKSHTRILFFINHLGFSETVGEFSDYDGIIQFDDKNAQASSLDITLKSAGIRTVSKELDAKLQGADFFNSEKFPDIKFISRSITLTGENTGEVKGDITMLGITKPVILKVKLNKADYNSYTNIFTAGFSAETVIKRSDFGMKAYIPAVGDEVRIEIYTELMNIDRKKQEAIKKG